MQHRSPLRLLRTIATLPIVAYRRLVSPLIGPHCRYYPTCSSYAQQAVREYGVARGSVLAAWRLLRCNPLSDGGFDYVEDQKLFRKRPTCDDHDHPHHDGEVTP